MVARLRLFGPAAEAAGTRSDVFDQPTVADLLGLAAERYGTGFTALLPHCQVWVNGEPAEPGTGIGPTDEVAVLPPVSGG